MNKTPVAEIIAEAIAWAILITCTLLLLTLPQWMPLLVDATYTPEPNPYSESED
jgi:hypothetical protein